MQPTTSHRDALFVRRIYASDSHQVLALLSPTLQTTPYCSSMDNAAVLDCLHPSPPTSHSVSWVQHDLLGAWDGEDLLGFVDLGVGYDHTNIHREGEQPLGLLRFLALPTDYLIAARVAQTLLTAADAYWQEATVRQVRAFSFSTGYPAFQSGAGLLPASWEDHMQFLSGAGYRLTERFYCLRYPLQRLLAETLPAGGGYTYRPQISNGEGSYQLFDGETRVALARLRFHQVLSPPEANPIAYLSDLGVAPKWRRRGVGRWLVRRLINDAYLLGCRQLVLHLNHTADAAVSLFAQVGFEEINYRGYTLEKRL